MLNFGLVVPPDLLNLHKIGIHQKPCKSLVINFKCLTDLLNAYNQR
jgi:hypothetical protein